MIQNSYNTSGKPEQSEEEMNRLVEELTEVQGFIIKILYLFKKLFCWYAEPFTLGCSCKGRSHDHSNGDLNCKLFFSLIPYVGFWTRPNNWESFEQLYFGSFYIFLFLAWCRPHGLSGSGYVFFWSTSFESVSRIIFWVIPYPDKQCCGSGMYISDPGSASASENYDLGNMIRNVNPGSRSWFLPIPDPGSKGQKGTGYRIRNTEI